MSDVEAPGARTDTTAPITSLAIGKLRAVGLHRAALTQNNGLIDAFAEVFASMAASQPVSITPVRNAESSATTADQRPSGTSEDVSSDSQFSQDTFQSDADVEPVAIGADQKAVRVTVDDDPQSKSEVERADFDASQDIEATPLVAQQVDVNLVDVRDSASQVGAAETPQVAAPEVVENDDSGRRRRDPRDSATAEPVKQTPGRSRDAEPRHRGNEPIHSVSDLADTDTQLPLDHPLENEAAGSSRRQRGRSGIKRETGISNLQTDSDANRARSGQRPEAIQAVTDDNASLAAQTQRSDAASRHPASRNVDSAITNIQTIASNVARSSPQNTAHGSAQAARTQAIEAPTSGRDVSRPAPDSGSSKNNTAETVSRVKLIQRVSKAFQHLGPEGGVVRLRLAPAELGSVRVEMRIHQRKVQARVIADTEAASAALREHLPELRQRLESQGMQVERLEIEAEQGEPFFGSQSDGRDRGNSRDANLPWNFGQPPSADETERPIPADSAAASVSHAAVQPSSGGVDVRL